MHSIKSSAVGPRSIRSALVDERVPTPSSTSNALTDTFIALARASIVSDLGRDEPSSTR